MNINYTTGFNHGYLLQKHLPGLLTQLLPSLTQSHEYIQGIREGAREYVLECDQKKVNQLKDLHKKRSDQERER